MILVIDNYDSFTYNLVQALGSLGQELLVRRNDDAVDAVLVAGRVAARSGQLTPDVGQTQGYGSVLRAGAEWTPKVSPKIRAA